MPRVFRKAREPFSSYSHFVGAVLSGLGLVLVLVRAAMAEGITALTIGAAIIFCLSLIALYSASCIYHFSLAGEHVLRVLKKLDHSMIYVLIAGSYTPIVLKFMSYPHSLGFVAAIWTIALVGIAVKLLWIDAPRLLSTILYLVLGWAIVVDFDAVLSMPPQAIALLAAGGVSYTIGGLIYIAKKPNFGPVLGFHELFHLFVLGGSICHYLLVLFFVL